MCAHMSMKSRALSGRRKGQLSLWGGTLARCGLARVGKRDARLSMQERAGDTAQPRNALSLLEGAG